MLMNFYQNKAFWEIKDITIILLFNHLEYLNPEDKICSLIFSLTSLICIKWWLSRMRISYKGKQIIFQWGIVLMDHKVKAIKIWVSILMKDLVSILEILVIFLQTIKENKILVALQTYHQTEYPKFLKI